MKARTGFWRTAVPGVALGLLTGCVNLDPKPDPNRYYVIDGAVEPVAAAPGECAKHYLVGPVRVAGYADQTAVVERRGGHEIVPLSLHRWAEPPGQSLPRTLTRRLARELPDSCVAALQSRTPTAGTMQVEIEVTRFELTDQNQASVAIRWRAFEPGNEGADRAGAAAATQAFDGTEDRVAAGLEALSRALDEVVGKLAVELAAH